MISNRLLSSARPATISNDGIIATNIINTYYKQYLLPVYKRPPVLFTKGKGCWLYSDDNEDYLDFTSGIAVNALGHGHSAVVNAIEQQSNELIHISNLYNARSPIALAEKLINSLKNHSNQAKEYWNDGKIFWCNSGTEAVEAAIKFARKWKGNDNDRVRIISMNGGFHGRTLGALSATPTFAYQKPFQPLLSGFTYANFNDIDSVKSLIDEDTCAVIVEPIQGEGGVNVADNEFLCKLRELCDEWDCLLIFDEIQCGLARTGKLWAHWNYDVQPDIVTLAKPLANGFPIGSVIMTERVAEAVSPGDHGSTFGGNPFICNIASAVFEELAGMESHVQKMGKYLHDQLTELQSCFPGSILRVKGKGLMLGLEVENELYKNIVNASFDQRLLLVGAGNNTIRLLPPLIITEEECDIAICKMKKAIKSK